MKTLCFDKTGTLTQDKMKLKNVYFIVNKYKILNISDSFQY